MLEIAIGTSTNPKQTAPAGTTITHSTRRSALRLGFVMLGVLLLVFPTPAQAPNVTVTYEGELPAGWKFVDKSTSTDRFRDSYLFWAIDVSPRMNEPGWADPRSAQAGVSVRTFPTKSSSLEELRTAIESNKKEEGQPAYVAATFSGYPALRLLWERVEKQEAGGGPRAGDWARLAMETHSFTEVYLLFLNGIGVRVQLSVTTDPFGGQADQMPGYARLKETGAQILQGLRIHAAGEILTTPPLQPSTPAEPPTTGGTSSGGAATDSVLIPTTKPEGTPLPGIGDVPGPENLPQGIIGVILPGLIGVLGSILGGVAGGLKTAVPGLPGAAGDNPESAWPPSSGGVAMPVGAGSAPAGPSFGSPDAAPPPVPGGIIGTPPGSSPTKDIEWTGPDGITRVLTFDDKLGRYYNNITGGYVDPGNIDGWKQNVENTKQKLDDFRIRNEEIRAQGLDHMTQTFDQIKADAATRDQIHDNLSKIEREVILDKFGAGDLYKPPGEPGNILDQVKKIRQELDQGKPADVDKLDRITKVYKDRISGKILGPSQQPRPGDGDKGILAETVRSSFKELVTGQDASGATSWKGTIGRGLIGVATGGGSEIVFTPVQAVDSMKTYVENGGTSSWDGFKKAVGDVLISEGINRGIGAAVKGLAAGASAMGKGAGAVISDVTDAVADAAVRGNSAAKAAGNAARAIGKAASQFDDAVSKPIMNTLRKVKDVLTAEIDIKVGGTQVIVKPRPIYGTSSVGTGPTPPRAPAAGAAAKSATKSASTQAAGEAAKPKGSMVSKPVSAADAAANKAARARERAAQIGEGKANIKSDPNVDVKGQTAGMTTPAQKQLQNTCDKYGVKVDARSTTKYAHDPIAQGKAVPKPEHVKAKTISPEDIALGAKKEDLGLVGYFNPKKPVQGKMTDPEFKKVMDRYKQRAEEFKDQWEHMKDHMGEGEKKILIKDGVVFDKKTGKPFTGDYDIFEIRDAVTGKPLPRYQMDPKGNVLFNLDGTPKMNPVRERIIKDLQQPPFNAQHGAHRDWKYNHESKVVQPGSPAGTKSDFATKQGIDKKILDKHKSTSDDPDPLITFGPEQKPAGSWFEESQPAS